MLIARCKGGIIIYGRNCPNCGAPYDNEPTKCAYCGTSYFDLSCIPLNEPFYLKLNVGTKEKPQIVTQKVYTTGASIKRNPEFVPCVGAKCRIYTPIIKSMSTEYELSFIGMGDIIYDKNSD